MRKALVVITVVACLGAGSAWGLEVYLNNGWHFTGEVKVSPRTVSVHSGTVTKEIPRGSVRSIELSAGEKVEYERRRAALGMAGEDWFKLGEWLEGKFQYAEAEKIYEKALEIDGEQTGARQALGYKKEQGKWVRTEEAHLRWRSKWLGEEGADGCYGLAKMYREKADEKGVERMLRQALIAWPRHAEALTMMRPITDKYVVKNKYHLPMEGTWGIFPDYNDHHKKGGAFMAYAMDFAKVDEKFRESAVERPTRVEDIYTWGAPVCASADGEVYSVENDFPDYPLGESGEFWQANIVCIQHAGNEQTIYGHLQKGSVVVKVGQKVKAGEMIARGGNSGSSMSPHMHWQMCDRDGIGLPVTFVDYVEVTRDGEKKVGAGKLEEGHFYRNSSGVKTGEKK